MSRLEEGTGGWEINSEGAPSGLRAEHTWAQAQVRFPQPCQMGLVVVLGRY